MRSPQLLHATLYFRGITMNKQDAQGEPSASRSVQDQGLVGSLDAI
jgi:hypothetical protein